MIRSVRVDAECIQYYPSIQTTSDVKTCKSIVRKRVVKGALEFLIRYTDNCTAWLAADLVTDNLKAMSMLNKAQVKGRRQVAAKRILKQGCLAENASRS